MTLQDLQDLPENKIKSISINTGLLGKSTQLKVMKQDGFFVVITREGILKYMGNAVFAYYSGIKNIHFKTFKNASNAIKFINQ